MAYYEYQCVNENCKEKEVVKEVIMSISEYSEEKLPKCECCGEPTNRVYSANFGAQNFDGKYRG